MLRRNKSGLLNLSDLRNLCQSLGLEVWHQGAAYGWDYRSWFGTQSRHLAGAFDIRDPEHERMALTTILSSTRKGRRAIKLSLAE